MTTATKRVPKRTTLSFGLCNLQTDATFLRGSEDGFGTDVRGRKAAHAKARAAGVNINGKRYCGGLATKMHDPMAWVSSRADVKRVAEARGLGIEGTVTCKAPEVEHIEKPYKVADNLVEREVSRIVQEEARGDVSVRERADLKEATQVRLKGSMK